MVLLGVCLKQAQLCTPFVHRIKRSESSAPESNLLRHQLREGQHVNDDVVLKLAIPALLLASFGAQPGSAANPDT
jgi:hypothetical protein